MENIDQLQKICRLIRYDIVKATSNAGSGHPSSSLSAVELMSTLFFGGPSTGGFFRYDLKNPQNLANDRIIFSKGHAAPLLYALYQVAGVISSEELMKIRTFDSPLEGHPTPRFPYVDVATGSLGQGLSVGVGMALGIRLKSQILNSKLQINPRVFVLLGDSEMAEGQIWEAMQIASYYKLNNLIAVLDVNRLGQRGETMLGWNLETYAKRAESFGWNSIVIDDGHDLKKIIAAYQSITGDRPTIIIAKTIKGKGVSFLENQDNWHGKVIPKDKLEEALKEIGGVDFNIRGKISSPKFQFPPSESEGSFHSISNFQFSNDLIPTSIKSTREAYGDALVSLGESNDQIVVLDAEVSNSTFAEKFAKKISDRFFEMFIAEQNMVSTALGLSKIEFIPFISTFAAFLTRAVDQIRIAQYSNPNLKFCGSHAGVSIGPDGSSQMGLEDIAIFRSILNSIIFYPSDAVSTFKLTQIMAENPGLFYLRTTREKLPIIYDENERFKIGGLKILKQSNNDKALVIAAGITVHEALKAYEKLKEEGINVAVVDLYCIKPIDSISINQLVSAKKNIIVVEDHYSAGGVGEAVKSTLKNETIKQSNNFVHLSVHKIPHSGTPQELLADEKIDSISIINTVRSNI